MLLRLDVAGCDIGVLLASSSEDGESPNLQRLNISRDLAADFRGLVQRKLSAWRVESENGDLLLRHFDPGAKLEGYEIEYLDLSEHESIEKQIGGLADDASLKVFAEEDDFISRLRFYVIALQPRNGPTAYCFRTYTPKRELTRSSMFGVGLKRGQYDRYRDLLFLFDEHVDCVLVGRLMFVSNKSNFEKIFRFYELLVSSATATLAVIEECIPIDNFDEFKRSCEGHLLKLAKLKNIAAKPYLKRITMADIKKVIARYRLPIRVVGKGAGQKILFEPADRWAILRLLDDDYLESTMTKTGYEVNSKRPMGA